MRLTLRQLQVFIAIVDTGSTAAAGVAIGLSQSAVSAALKDLEGHWETALFDRIGRGLVLTPAGNVLAERARSLLYAATGLESAFRLHGTIDPVEQVTLAASDTLANWVLPGLLADWLRHAPETRLQLHVGNSSTVCDQVASLQVDAGFIEGHCQHPTLRLTAWGQDRLIVVGAPALVDAGAAPATQRWLLREPRSGTRRAFDQHYLPELGGELRVCELGSTAAILLAARRATGIACVSERAVGEDLVAGTLKRVASLDPVARTFWLVEHPQRQRSAMVRGLLGRGGLAQDPVQ